MTRYWSKRSLDNLRGVHPDLVAVMRLALVDSPHDFGVTEGVRSRARQDVLVQEGKSRTMKSMHLIQADGYGHAVDVVVYVDGHTTWEFEHYRAVAGAVLLAARKLGVSIAWGGDWATFKDGPHFQLEAQV